MPHAFFVLSWALSAAGTFVADAGAKCCFTNPAYTGVCQVMPQEGETCKSILDYLNAPNSVGKSYCGETNVRGGWQQTSCASGAQMQHRQAQATAQVPPSSWPGGEDRARGSAVRK